MTKLGMFGSYLAWTSLMAIIGWGISFLLSLNSTTSVVNTFAVGTPLGIVFAIINICIYPLQIALGLTLFALSESSSVSVGFGCLVIAGFLLGSLGLLLRDLDKKRSAQS